MLISRMKKSISKTLVVVSLFSGSFAITTLTGPVKAEAAMGLTNATVNFRTGPSTGYPVMWKLPGVTPIDVISHNATWSKINSEGEVGYVSSSYIKFTSTGVIMGRVNLRSSGSMTGSIITKIPKWANVKVLSGPVNGWFKVVYGTKTGYIYKDYVNVDETAALKTELAKSNIGMIFINNLPKFSSFNPITAWNISASDYTTKMLLLTKKKGSLVEVAKVKITGGYHISPGEVIRDWKTTSNNEVIRITYDDPETIPFYFITVTEPGGKVTTRAIQTSMKAALDWESFQYDE